MSSVSKGQARIFTLCSIIISATFSRTARICLHLRRAGGTWLSFPFRRKTYSSHVQLPAYRSTLCATFLRLWLVTIHLIGGKAESSCLSVYCGEVFTEATEECFPCFFVVESVEEGSAIIIRSDDCSTQIAGAFVEDGEQVGLHPGGQSFLP